MNIKSKMQIVLEIAAIVGSGFVLFGGLSVGNQNTVLSFNCACLAVALYIGDGGK